MSGKAVRETLGFLGVMATLVFVGLEIRQNTIAARAAAYQEIGFHIASEFYLEGARDPAFAELMVVASDSSRLDEISDAGWVQLRNQMMGAMRTMETVWLQVEEGLLPPDALEQFGLLAVGDGYLSGPRFDRMWPDVRRRLSDELQAVGAKDTVHESGCTFARKTKVELVVPSALANEVIEAITQAAYTGNVDGKIFVHDLSEVVKIRTGERGAVAI